MSNPHPARPSLSILVPVYRSALILPDLVARIESALAGYEKELILINDGSPDNSAEVVKELAAGYAWVRGISLMRNYGQHNALLCGIRAASNDVIVTMDDDLQHPPEEVPKLLEKLA
ncbi:MAG TPA: glycosyltransferase, partial [Herpetosiphonaceae bacterium]|nr:glycosyltransferase [Herpetosiphonaceae bacterium]